MTLIDIYSDTYGDVYGEETQAFPDVFVEAAWEHPPSDAGVLTWVELANWRSIDIQRGRQRELDLFQPGTATVVCSDRDRQLDPTNAAATYAGNLLPMRRLRVRAVYNAVDYPLFSGYIDSFEHDYAGPHHGDVTATLTATDGFKVLAAADLPSSAYMSEVGQEGAWRGWRLGEPSGTTVAYHSGPVVDPVNLTVYGTPEFGVDGLVSRDTDTAMEILAAEPKSGVYVGRAIGAPPLSLEAIWAGTATGGLIAGESDVAETGGFSLSLETGTGKARWAVAHSGTTVAVVSTVAINDGSPHHLVGTWESDGTVTLYVDGVSTGTPGNRPTAGYDGTGHTFIIGGGPFGSTSVDGAVGVIDEVRVYSPVLSAARVLAHSQTRATPWDNDTSAVRMGRILDEVDWPAALRDIDTGGVVLQSAELDGSALDHLQRVAASDFGALYMSADGDMTFISRDNLWNRTPSATFGDDPADPTELGYRSLKPDYGDELIRNDVTVSRAEGVAQRVTDAASILEFLRHSHTVDGLIHGDDSFSYDAAAFLVSEYAQPRRRISNLTVAPQGDPAGLFPQVLGRELLDAITVIDRPAGGTANEQDSSIEGVSHSIRPLWWETRWNLTPAFGTGGADEWIWELDNTAGPGLGFERLAF